MKSLIYQGEVSHVRRTPRQHSFRYPVYFYAFDLDELLTLVHQNPLFGYNQLRPVAIHDCDYLQPGAEPIREKFHGYARRRNQHRSGTGGAGDRRALFQLRL